MTILTSLLIAAQGLIPSLTPLTIGSQGLLRSQAPPPRISPLDLPGGGGAEPKKRPVTVRVRGVRLTLVSNVDPVISISSKIVPLGTTFSQSTSPVIVDLTTSISAQGCTTYLSASRSRQTISLSLPVVGCKPLDMAKLTAIALALLSEE